MTIQLDIREYGAREGGKYLCTKAIQMAIDEAGKCGGEVYVPSGIYLTGALFLKSNNVNGIHFNRVEIVTKV